MARGLAVSVSDQPGFVLVALGGECAVGSASQCRDALARVVTARPGRVVVDLSGMETLNAEVTGVLVDVQERLIAQGATMALTCGGKLVAVLVETGADQRLPVYGSVRAAAMGTLRHG